ncbi:MAG: hypothetical protein IKM90_08035 [Bacteroidaceae bacterium]|nr:hypothetical protein [Bacteroidaceae bacterium]
MTFMKKRSISNELLEMLKTGIFKPIVDIVKVDPYLDMEMRGKDGVMVYYRGGKVITVNEQLVVEGLDSNYYSKGDKELPLPQQKDAESFLDYIRLAKEQINLHESTIEGGRSKRKLIEKEFQQRVVFENNLSANAENTDYFIADVEWADNNTLGGRADIVAFRWNHMEHRKRVLQLTLIEVKQGDKAIKTTFSKDGKPSAGLRKHYDDYLRFKENHQYFEKVASDMLEVLKQKVYLGLIKGLDKLFESGNHKYTPAIEPTPDFIFLLANYHHYGSILPEECKLLPPESRFFMSSLMGYGLYKDFAVSMKDLEEKWPFIFE